MTKRKMVMVAAFAVLVLGTKVYAGGQSGGRAAENAVKITATYAHFGGIPTDTVAGKAWTELMQKKTGVNLNITWNYIPYAEYAEKINVILAANDLTDLTFIMSRAIAAPYEAQGLFEDVAKHWDKLPLYQAYLKEVPYGMEKISNSDGTVYGFFGGELPRLERGVSLINPMAIRYDTFQQLGIDAPQTTEELLDAARKIKTAYPDKYPVSWGLQFLTYTYKTNNGIFWDGSKYVYGPMTNNYRAMLTFLNRLYTEKLLDNESITDNSDARTRKALNGSSYVQLGVWFNEINSWNSNAESNAVWALVHDVTDPSFGPGWQGITNVNERTIAYNGEGTYIKAGARNLDVLLKLCDLSYDPDTIRLISWGVEGLTYNLKPDRSPTFVDKFHQSSNFWVVGDDYGIRASSKFRPGLQGPIDTRAFIDCAPLENAILNGKFVQVSYELAHPDENWPNSPWIPSDVFAPPIAFTPEENNENAVITTAVQTYVDEQRIKFITGELSLNQWDAYTARIRSMNIQNVLDMRNKKAAAFK
jgi:putative aldouronate transport system substrate-binding protein